MRLPAQKQANESLQQKAIFILGQLDAWTPTAESLKATKIGIFLNSLRKNPDASEAVKTKANHFVKSWAAMLKPHHPAGTTPAKPSHINVSLARRPSMDSLGTGESHTPDARSPVEITPDPAFDAVDVDLGSSLNDKARDTTVKMFSQALGGGILNADEKLLFWKARQIEAGMNSEYHGVSDKYKSQFRTLLANLKNLDNLKLRADVLAGRIVAREMATMSSEDLMSESAKHAKQHAEQINKHWASTAKSTEAVTDEFRCGKCGKRKSTYYQKQTRSADEPMTTFVTCMNCGNKWKFC
ncbi:RNA polymerase II elongation factor [Podochytrium sp. JEL0797]|nr:RNA polymerase II elongation factor [Podochytrium sp. JEL0797]